MARKPKKADSNISKLPLDSQIKEVQKLAKRANVRLKLLEDKGVINDAYHDANYFNESKGRGKNRFYEGGKYTDKQELTQTFQYLSSFLNNEVSTLSGVKNVVKNKAQQVLKEDKSTAFKMINNLPQQEKVYLVQELSKQANKQLKELEDNNVDYFAYAKAMHYNEVTGREKNRFYRGGKFKDKKELNVHLQNVMQFLKSDTSTMEGIQKVYNNKINKFREKGIKIGEGKEKDFMDFLSSVQFKALKQYADSNQILETYVDSRNAKQDADKINKEFQKFLEGEVTLDVVQERLNVAKWQGKLFK